MARSKRGRPRLAGERYPGGRLHPRPSECRSDTQIRRIVEQGLALGLDPMLGSQAGRLRLQGRLNDRHLAMVDYIARVYGRHEAYTGLRRRTRSPGYEVSASQVAHEPRDDAAARAAHAEFLALEAAMSAFPATAREIVERLCVDDLHVLPQLVPDLIALLEHIDDGLAGVRRGAPLSRKGLSLRRSRARTSP